MPLGSAPPPSHLFLVRLWAAADADGQAAWRGKVQHVASGEARYFSDWPTLIDLLNAILPDLLSGTPAPIGAPRAAEAGDGPSR